MRRLPSQRFPVSDNRRLPAHSGATVLDFHQLPEAREQIDLA